MFYALIITLLPIGNVFDLKLVIMFIYSIDYYSKTLPL